MSNLLYVVAILLLVGWAIGVFAFSIGGFIHILIVLALFSVLFRQI